MLCGARCQAPRKGSRDGGCGAAHEDRLLESSSWPSTWPHRKANKELSIGAFPAGGHGGRRPEPPASVLCLCPPTPHTHCYCAPPGLNGHRAGEGSMAHCSPSRPKPGQACQEPGLKLAVEHRGPASYLTPGVGSCPTLLGHCSGGSPACPATRSPSGDSPNSRPQNIL